MQERSPLQAPLDLPNLLPRSNKVGERLKAIHRHHSNHLPLLRHPPRLPQLLAPQGWPAQDMILPYDRLDGGLVFCSGSAVCQFSKQVVNIREAMLLFATFDAPRSQAIVVV